MSFENHGALPGGYDSFQAYNGGGFAPPANQDPPPAPDHQSRSRSSNIDRQRMINHLSEYAPIDGGQTRFDVDTIKLLMSTFDLDCTISFDELNGLYKSVKALQDIYCRYRQDRSGSIDERVLHDALSQFGYLLSPPLVDACTEAASGGITFKRFVRAGVVVKQLSEAFVRLDRDGDGLVLVGGKRASVVLVHERVSKSARALLY